LVRKDRATPRRREVGDSLRARRTSGAPRLTAFTVVGARSALACIAASLLTACAVTSAPTVPTAYPIEYLPTIVAQTGEAAFATGLAVTPTASPTLGIEFGTATASVTPPPSPSPTPEPGFGAYAEIRFLSPGPMSKVVSPLHLQVLLVAGDSGVVRIELLGEDGRALARHVMRVSRNEQGVYRALEVPFEIRAAGEKAWLQISSEDEFGRLQSLNSLPLLLLSLGTSQLNPPGNIVYERAVVQGPQESEADTDGVVDVAGRMWPVNDEPVFLELVLPNGRIAGARVLEFTGGEAQPFRTTIPYKLPPGSGELELQPVRLLIRQMDAALGIPLYVYSRVIYLPVL